MKQHLIQKGNIDANKVFYIYNGYDKDDFENVEFFIDPSYFTISHIGMLSDSQPVISFLYAIKSFYDIKHPICKYLKLRLIGNVSNEKIKEIKEIVPELLVEHIGYVQKKEAISYMFSSDLLFNSLAEMENSELLISGKLMEYIAAKKPILCLGNPNGDAANLLSNFQYCAVFDRKNVILIIEFLKKIFENWINKITFAVEDEKFIQYSRYETTHQLANLLKKYI